MRDAGPAPPVFDGGLFQSLADVLGAAPLGALTLEAEAEIGRRLDAIAALADAGAEPATLRTPAHDLAGLAGQVGLAALSEAARRLERAARAGGEGLPGAADAVLDLAAPSLGALAAARAALDGG